MELDSSLVIDWNGRSRRTRKPPPTTYFEEFVATDPWYVRELLADVPAEEYHAAVECETWGDGEGEEGDETEDEEGGEESDSSYSEEAEESSDAADIDDEGSGDTMDTDVDSEAASTDRYGPCPPTPRESESVDSECAPDTP